MGFLRLSATIFKESVPFARRFATNAKKIPPKPSGIPSKESWPVFREVVNDVKIPPKPSGIPSKESWPVFREVVNDVKVSGNNKTRILIDKVVVSALICAPFVYFSEYPPLTADDVT
ncbi:hypothetical protein POM88_015676 [Heracleum sosnowskyi]|uniref:Uncharacterized protein n=1 Tax=Heracleum sosnowskyi TaxID=360622 RepID=A0AAD8MXM5_9APIA|nr:hypothetical protein POM88_015676 [Heracleum sosnowskyi]